MKPIFISVGTHAVERIELDADATAGQLRARLKERDPTLDPLHLFKEDGEEALDDDDPLDLGDAPVLHASRCKKLSVTVAYLSGTFTRSFAPGTTIGRVTKWATKEAKLGKEEAEEHVLQRAGTRDQPPKNAHLGSFADGSCTVAFDLVRKQLVQG